MNTCNDGYAVEDYSVIWIEKGIFWVILIPKYHSSVKNVPEMCLKLCKPYINGFRNMNWAFYCFLHAEILQWVGVSVSTP